MSPIGKASCMLGRGAVGTGALAVQVSRAVAVAHEQDVLGLRTARPPPPPPVPRSP